MTTIFIYQNSELIKEYIRNAKYRCEHLQETVDSMEESFLLSTEPTETKGGFVFEQIFFYGTVLLGFWFAKILK